MCQEEEWVPRRIDSGEAAGVEAVGRGCRRRRMYAGVQADTTGYVVAHGTVEEVVRGLRGASRGGGERERERERLCGFSGNWMPRRHRCWCAA